MERGARYSPILDRTCTPLILYFYTVVSAMFVHIVAMRFHGKALDQTKIRTAESVRAEVIIAQENSNALGRYSDVARASAAGDGRDQLLPALYDCRLSHMGHGGFVLTGLELIGSVAFAQNWWCRPAIR